METGFIVPENIDPQRPPKELTGGELEDYACPEGDTLLTPKYSIIKSQCMRMVKNKIIGSTKAKMEYFNEGLLDEILHLLNKHDVPSEIIFNMLSILFCYTNKKKSNPKIGYDFNKICEAFAPHKDFCAKLVSTLNTTMINKGDDRIIDLCLQIIRNCLTNNIMRARDAFMQDKDQEIVTLVPQNASDKVDICKMFAALTTNNKRVSLVAQIISELCKDFPEVKDLLILDKTIIDSIAAKIQTLESSLLTCLINLCSGHNEITNYVREQINIAKLISFLRYQYPDINCKVAYLATLLSSDEEMTDDHKSLIKQIVFQILRMLFTSPDCQIDTKIVLEGITMLHNLVGNEHREQETQSNIASFGLNQDHRLRKYALGQICDTGIIDHLAQILKKSSTKELFRQNFVNNNDKDQLELNCTAVEKNSNGDVPMEESKTTPDCSSKEESPTDHFKILKSSLEILQYIMTSKESKNINEKGDSSQFATKLIELGIPQEIFNILEDTKNSEIKLLCCECIRILSRAKRPIKVQMLEEGKSLSSIFEMLLNDLDGNIKNNRLEESKIQITHSILAIVCNFSIDFPALVLGFERIIPILKDCLELENSLEIRLTAIKTTKNLLYPGHHSDIYRKAEKLIFECIPIKYFLEILYSKENAIEDRSELIPLIQEQAEFIFKYITLASKKGEGQNDQSDLNYQQTFVFDTLPEEDKERIANILDKE